MSEVVGTGRDSARGGTTSGVREDLRGVVVWAPKPGLGSGKEGGGVLVIGSRDCVECRACVVVLGVALGRKIIIR